jgi:hypothetical protein
MADRPFDQTWDELEQYVEDIFFTELNKKVDGVSVDLADVIEKKLTKQLDDFFRNLGNMVGQWTTDAPDWVQYHSGPWPDYSKAYAVWKRVKERGTHDYFKLSELPFIKRNSKASRKLRRKMVKTKEELKATPSLAMELRELGNPSEYWGNVSVWIESHTNTAGADGKRRYNKGTYRKGVAQHSGRIMSPTTDFVTLHVQWLPLLDGLDVLERGVTEESGGMALPDDVQKKLMNRLFRNDGKQAYRPLLGPYMLWYQDTTVRKMLKDVSAPYGPQL